MRLSAAAGAVAVSAWLLAFGALVVLGPAPPAAPPTGYLEAQRAYERAKASADERERTYERLERRCRK